jgi:L-ascorbate metabolism protein UlaG (beta-lactamase superfamily)
MATASRQRSWIAHLWHEWTVESRRPIAPAFAHPQPNEWPNDRLTAAWLGHSTVLINFFGLTILTDPVLFPRCGVRLPFFTIGPKRLTKPALTVRELPPIDLILLSHAHFDHIDTRTLHQFAHPTRVVTATRTRDLLRWTKLRDITELAWDETHRIETSRGDLTVRAFRVQHWGARLQYDNYRGYNGYVLERNGRRIIFSGDTALTNCFEELRDDRPYDLALMGIGAYEPWIRSHCTPEQAIAMADAAGARFLLPIHHQTFKLSFEPFREPIERFVRELADAPERVALRDIGETFELPQARAPHLSS